MDKLKQLIQDALNAGRIVGAVILDGAILTSAGKGKGGGSVVQPPLEPIVKPAVLDTKGDFILYADGSIGYAPLDTYNAGYKGPGYPDYGFFPSDALDVFPQIKDDPALAGAYYYNQSQLHSPFGLIDWQQGSSATLSPDGHGYVKGSVHAIRGTEATHLKTTDFPALLAKWSSATPPYYMVQVEQGASGKPFP